jgi:hypothetical protein
MEPTTPTMDVAAPAPELTTPLPPPPPSAEVAGEAQARAAAARRPHRLESLLLMAVFTAAYALLGIHVIGVNHVIVFDAIDHLSRAYMVWWNAPPKLAAVGFDYPPVTTLVFLPVALLKPLATSLIGLALTSAVFAGATIVALNALLARCELPRAARVIVLVLFGLNPLWAFYASNGMSEVVYGFFFTLAISGFISWYLSSQARFLVGSGISLALLALADYDLGAVALVLAVMVAAVLYRRRAASAEVEGWVTALLAPVGYALVVWTMFNVLIVGSAFGWLKDSTTLSVNSDYTARHLAPTLSSVISYTARILTGVTPIALVAIGLLVLTFISRRSVMSLALAALVAFNVLVFGASAFIDHSLGGLLLGNSIPLMLIGVMGAAWAYRTAGSLRPLVLLVIAATLGVSILLAWQQMQTYPYQNLEQAFTRALSKGGDLTGTTSRGGFRVGVDTEQQMAAYLNAHVHTGDRSVLADNAQTFGVILLSGRPGTIFNRIDEGDSVWRSVRNDPYGRVRYLLIDTQARDDLIRQRYPLAASGSDEPYLTPVFTTTPARYTLVRVARTGPTEHGR